MGVVVGMVLELFADEDTLRRTEKQNECLRLRVEQLESEQADKGVQVIEIHDDRPQPESYFTPF